MGFAAFEISAVVPSSLAPNTKMCWEKILCLKGDLGSSMDYRSEFFGELVKIIVGITSEILSGLDFHDVHQIFLAFYLSDTW